MAEPNAKAAVLTTVKRGATLELRATEGEWFKVATVVGTVRVQGYVPKSAARIETGKDEPLPPPVPASQASRGAPAPSTSKSAAPALPGAAATKFGLSATLLAGAKSVGIVPVSAKVTRIVDRVDSARAAALAMPVGTGALLPTNGSTVITYVWTLDRMPAAPIAASATPSFVIRYRDAPGLSPDDVSPAIVHVIGSAAGPRVIGAVRGRVDQGTRAQADWDLERDLKHDVIASKVEIAPRGVARISPIAALPPGDYAVVMRPTGNKKFAGASVLDEAEEGRVFGLAWVFVVK